MAKTQTNPRSLANLKKGVKITKETALENNKKSTEAKRRKKTMREALELMMENFTVGEDNTKITYQDAILITAVKEAQKGKRNGNLSNADIDNFARMLSPMLDDKKRAILKKIVEELKKI